MHNDNATLPASLSYVYVDHSTKSLNLRRKLGHTHAVIIVKSGLNILLTTAQYLQCLKISSVYKHENVCVVPLEYVKERK